MRISDWSSDVCSSDLILGTAGIAKVVRLKDGPVVGVHLVGDRVGELITEAQLVVGWEAHPEDVAPSIHAHHTQSEAHGERSEESRVRTACFSPCRYRWTPYQYKKKRQNQHHQQ